MQKNISIIVATKDRKDILLESTLQNILVARQFNCEYIVVNDGDDLSFSTALSDVVLLNNQKRGVSKARNTGAAIAIGKLLFFIDDDMWITSKTIETIISLQKDNYFDDAVVVMNWTYPEQLQNNLRHTKIGRYILRANYHTLEGRSNKKIDYSQSLLPINGMGSGSFVIAKNIFEKIGGYSEQIIFQGEDIDMAQKITKQNIGMFLSTPVTCFHNQKDRLDIKHFLLREENGYRSQVAAGMADMKISKIRIYGLLLPLSSLFRILFELTPNSSFFDLLTFRLIGILSSLTYVKAIHSKER
jgi:glycosyltransferase involved in cell wall biosynthesis